MYLRDLELIDLDKLYTKLRLDFSQTEIEKIWKNLKECYAN